MYAPQGWRADTRVHLGTHSVCAKKHEGIGAHFCVCMCMCVHILCAWLSNWESQLHYSLLAPCVGGGWA